MMASERHTAVIEIRISVCMAAYNGEAFIRDQLDTILPQLDSNDEVIVVNDCSTDSTSEVVRSMADPRIRLINLQQNVGYVAAFEHALSESRGQYIFLSDQDDLWLPGRVEDMIIALQKADVVASNFGFFGHAPRNIELRRLRAADSNRRWLNLLLLWIGVMPYYGCAMAFTRHAAPLILPFPSFLTETHDQWIAMVGILNCRMAHLERETLSRRLHDSNTTPKKRRPTIAIVRSRIMLARAFAPAMLRTHRRSRALRRES